MTKRNKAERQAALQTASTEANTTTPEAVIAAPRILEAVLPAPEPQTEADIEEAIVDAEIDADIERRGSVVKREYKIKYKLKARERGDKGKAAKRSTWDWLAQQMAPIVLNEKAKLKLGAFDDFMRANGVDIHKWMTEKYCASNGWEGRLRMTAGLALRRLIAESGVLHFADGSQIELPEEEMNRLKTKFDL